MDATESRSAPDASKIEETPPTDKTRPSDPAARRGVQRILDQSMERGQLRRLHRWATMLNEMCHGEE